MGEAVLDTSIPQRHRDLMVVEGDASDRAARTRRRTAALHGVPAIRNAIALSSLSAC
jgi:hypothetical protein